MRLYNIIISTTPNWSKNTTLYNLLGGGDIFKYYDGNGLNMKTRIKNYYFDKVPMYLTNNIRNKIKNISYISYKITES